MKPSRLLAQFAATSLCVLLFNSCSDDTSSPATNNLDAKKTEVIQNYANIVYASYADALASAQIMGNDISAFTENPTQASLQKAKESWLNARNWYGQTEVFRFYGGPIDDDNGPEGQINAWPLDENYIDYVNGNPDAGIINNTKEYPELSEELITGLNEQGGETNISTGFHAIEFLLWGQDLTNPSEKKPGQRPLEDYTTNKNAERRKQYLHIVTTLLIKDLQYLVDQWATPSNVNYRSVFIKKNTDSALTNILQGMSSLSGGELSGERMAVALGKGDQEDEHSCFSDNTHNNIRMNMKGIKNIWTSTYLKSDGSTIQGTGIYALIKEKDQSIANEVNNYFISSEQKINDIQSPFDYEISQDNIAGNQRVALAIKALQDQNLGLVKVADKFGLRLNVE